MHRHRLHGGLLGNLLCGCFHLGGWYFRLRLLDRSVLCDGLCFLLGSLHNLLFRRLLLRHLVVLNFLCAAVAPAGKVVGQHLAVLGGQFEVVAVLTLCQLAGHGVVGVPLAVRGDAVLVAVAVGDGQRHARHELLRHSLYLVGRLFGGFGCCIALWVTLAVILHSHAVGNLLYVGNGHALLCAVGHLQGDGLAVGGQHGGGASVGYLYLLPRLRVETPCGSVHLLLFVGLLVGLDVLLLLLGAGHLAKRCYLHGRNLAVLALHGVVDHYHVAAADVALGIRAELTVHHEHLLGVAVLVKFFQRGRVQGAVVLVRPHLRFLALLCRHHVGIVVDTLLYTLNTIFNGYIIGNRFALLVSKVTTLLKFVLDINRGIL